MTLQFCQGLLQYIYRMYIYLYLCSFILQIKLFFWLKFFTLLFCQFFFSLIKQQHLISFANCHLPPNCQILFLSSRSILPKRLLWNFTFPVLFAIGKYIPFHFSPPSHPFIDNVILAISLFISNKNPTLLLPPITSPCLIDREPLQRRPAIPKKLRLKRINRFLNLYSKILPTRFVPTAKSLAILDGQAGAWEFSSVSGTLVIIKLHAIVSSNISLTDALASIVAWELTLVKVSLP